MLSILTSLFDPLLSVVYPQPCHVCGDSVEASADGVACVACWEKTRIFTGEETLCGKCGAFLGTVGNAHGAMCGKCVDHHYDKAFAAGIYEHALAAAIVNLKKDPATSRRVRETLVSAFHANEFDEISTIIPVPLSKKRQIERGFNQAEILSRAVAIKTGVKMLTDALARTVHTPMHRAAMDRKARAATVKNAFSVTQPEIVKDAHVLLVDDVLTTGATASSCARVLKKAGAERVSVMTLARAV
jgi:ComF family protein